MSQMKRPFQVGDRVKHKASGRRGTVSTDECVSVKFDDDHGAYWVPVENLIRLKPKPKRKRLEFWAVVDGRDNSVVFRSAGDEYDANNWLRSASKPHYRAVKFVEAKEKKK